jgi:hypothetical protein
MLGQAFQVAPDGIGDIGLRFSPGLSLGNSPRKSWTIGYKDPVLILFDYHSKFHLGTSVVYPPNGTLRGIFQDYIHVSQLLSEGIGPGPVFL